MDTLSKFITPVIIFLMTITSGFWLSRSGKPYPTAIFNVHKLVALGAVITTAIQVSKALTGAESQAFTILLLIVATLCVVALFATGALMSIGKLSYETLLTIHRVALVLVLASLAGTVYLLAGRML